MLINFHFIFLIIGNVIVSITQPFFLNASAKIATYWFLKENVQILLLREQI
jgi:hypothetical protein